MIVKFVGLDIKKMLIMIGHIICHYSIYYSKFRNKYKGEYLGYQSQHQPEFQEYLTKLNELTGVKI